jgi:hypothetical protein
MKHHNATRRLALVAGLSALAIPCMAHANARVGPPAGDILSAWVKARLNEIPEHDALVTDSRVTSDMVTSPATIYAPVRSRPYVFRGTVWTSAFSSLATQGNPLTRAQATEALAWDLGMTNGYPGVADAEHPSPDLGATWAGTQLAKAGVSEDVARKALALSGQGTYAVAAGYAVAVQILIDKLACFEPTQWPLLGLRQDVLERFLLAQTVADLRDYDLIYLARLLQGELSTWKGGQMTVGGRRQLPTALRVARVAAAYRDMQGYVAAPCTDTGAPRTGVASLYPGDAQRPLCLVAANDRAVLHWYLVQLDRQTDPQRINFVTATAMRMSRMLRPMRPLWLGVLSKDLLALSANIEVVESLVADQVSLTDATDANANRYGARRALLLCERELAE